MPDDTLAILAGGLKLTGWQECQVTRGIEQVPSSFVLRVTERYPGAGQIDIEPGQPCQVMLGGDLVVTGYIDRYAARIGARGHEITITGRSKLGDLVDCSAIVDKMMVTVGTVKQLAEQLANPLKIDVVEIGQEGWSITGDDGRIPPFAINLGETAYEVLERTARWKALLVYDDTQGRIVLSGVGTQSMASGVEEGVNVQGAAVEYAMDERFSDYIPAMFSTEQLYNYGTGANPSTRWPPVKDASVPRYRPHFVVSEQFLSGQYLAVLRATWEAARRKGRSQAVTVTVDSWRDSAGTLWTPNMLAPLHLPSLKIVRQTWLIGSVTYLRSAHEGTTAELVLMPPDAFTPEPAFVQPFDAQIYNDLHPPLNTPIEGPS